MHSGDMNNIADLIETTDEYQERINEPLPVDDEIAQAMKWLIEC